jgi:hypothetical protein
MSEVFRPLVAEGQLEVIKQGEAEQLVADEVITEVRKIRALIDKLIEQAAEVNQQAWATGADPEDEHALHLWSSLRWLDYAADPEAWPDFWN